jgi:hypothetical protein
MAALGAVKGEEDPMRRLKPDSEPRDRSGPVPAARADWREVETRGFAVVPGFLSSAECEELLVEWRAVASDAGALANPNNTSRVVSSAARERLGPRLAGAMDRVAACTSTRVDRIRGGQFYATGLGIDFDWHNDHDAYFHTQDFISYLNFWIPIQKPDPARSGVALLPHDRLRARDPALAAWLHGHGAISTRSLGDRTEFFDAERDEVAYLDTPLDDLCESPRVGPGDLVLMRGDLLHRTQDVVTERVAVSFRCVSSRSVISRARLMRMSFHKFNVMAGNRLAFVKRFAAFSIAGKEVMTVAESEAILEVLSARIAEVCRASGRDSPTSDELRAIVHDLAIERRLSSGTARPHRKTQPSARGAGR